MSTEKSRYFIKLIIAGAMGFLGEHRLISLFGFMAFSLIAISHRQTST
jgi:hypothetical protein